MNKSFNSVEFLKDLSTELVDHFDRAARATTPGLVGSARETAVREKLELILPPIISIGSGAVIDSFGGTNCPVFSVNNDPHSTFYPCEGVASVGEIKSSMGKSELIDSFEKIRSAKNLQRFAPNPESFRKYGNSMSITGAPQERLDPKTKFEDQIFGFILCGKFSQKPDTIIKHYQDLVLKTESWARPNILVSLQDGCLVYLDATQNKVSMDTASGSGIALTTIPNGNFQFLLSQLNWIANNGRTSPFLPFQRYVVEGDGSMQILQYIEYAT